MTSKRAASNQSSSLKTSLKRGCYFCISTLQQTQWLCRDLGIEFEIFMQPAATELISVISRADDLYGDLTQTARIIVMSEDQQAVAAEMLALFRSDETYWTFILLETIGTADKYKMSVSKALDIKTKTATKLSKSAAKVLDLRNIQLGACSKLFDSTPEVVREAYKGFPFTAEFMLKDNLTEEDIVTSWSWTSEESQVVELYKKLFHIDGVEDWGEFPYANALILKSVYDRYDSAEENSNAPVIVKTTAYYIRPFLNQMWNGASHQEMFEMYAIWIYGSTKLHNNALCPGLREKVSRGGRRYLMFSPSAAAIRNWLDITEHL